MLLPDLHRQQRHACRHLAVGAGKDGNIYVVDRDNMGKFNAAQQPASGRTARRAPLRGRCSAHARPISTARCTTATSAARSRPSASRTPSCRGDAAARSRAVPFTYPGTSPAVSANGTTNAHRVGAREHQPGGAARLRRRRTSRTSCTTATRRAGGRDQFGAGNKFITPTIAGRQGVRRHDQHAWRSSGCSK